MEEKRVGYEGNLKDEIMGKKGTMVYDFKLLDDGRSRGTDKAKDQESEGSSSTKKKDKDEFREVKANMEVLADQEKKSREKAKRAKGESQS